MRGYPTREEAERLVREGERRNPGSWGDHCRVAARCAEKIAASVGMDPEKAYILGLLHDIGRTFGVFHMPHIYHGYHYMMELGYSEAARICLTHSFSTPDFRSYIGNYDVTPEQKEELLKLLQTVQYDDYDRLIQLCDCLAGPGVVMDLEKRMLDVKNRYGEYPQIKWDNNLALRAYFENKAGKDLYEIVG